ncbi:MAG: 30S ribosomal protein S15 [Eubacteriales bacterium]|nr:30S ribosomal protein S15 [Clostridia bacterium]MDY2696138.1 30S ribosomal protein S15 [Eubacteriales bacterium]
MDKVRKQEIINQFKQSENDTGSAQVQVALLTERIKELTEHLKKNHNDNHSRRGLSMLIGQRKSFLKYIEERDIEAYRQLKKDLQIR